jgi:hypothetical protein
VAANVTASDVMALVMAMRGLVQTAADVGPVDWQRFLDLHLAGLRIPPSSDVGRAVRA